MLHSTMHHQTNPIFIAFSHQTKSPLLPMIVRATPLIVSLAFQALHLTPSWFTLAALIHFCGQNYTDALRLAAKMMTHALAEGVGPPRHISS